MFNQKLNGELSLVEDSSGEVSLENRIKDSLDLSKRKTIFKQPQKWIISIIGVFLIFILAFLSWQYFFEEPTTSAKFELTATMFDEAGIDPETVFVLKSSEDLSAKTIQKIITFSPEIDFEVKKINDSFLGGKIFEKALAQENNQESVSSSFEIKPKESLRPDTIYRVIINEESADREYGWAYQVKAPLQVISTYPGNQGTSVPVDSGIEINFNREGIVNPEKYFSITPKVQGKFTIDDATLIFLPDDLNPGTIYKVTLEKGLKASGSDDILKEDYTFSFETGFSYYTNRNSYFNFQNDFLEFIPDHKPVFKFSSYNLNVNQLEFSIYKLSDANEFLSSYQDSRDWSLGWTYYHRRQAGSLYQPRPEAKLFSFNAETIKIDYQEFIEIPQELEQGYYLIDVKYDDVLYGERHQQAWLQITPVAHYFSITNNQSLLWVNDFNNKSALEGAKITHLEGAEEIDLGRTDQEGLLQFATPENLKNQNQKKIVEPQFFKVDHSQYSTAIIKITDSWGYYRQVNEGDVYWDYLSTDRYVYQMNDTLRYWGVLKGRNEDLRQKKVMVSIGQNWGGGSVLMSQEVVISSFDTIQGQIKFEGLTPGFYYLTVALNGKTVSQSPIQVLTYTKPAYQIIVTPSKNAIFAGESVNFKVEALFFDETPVANLQLKYSGYWQNSINGQLTLDEFGQGNFSYTPSYYESGYWPRSLSLSVVPKMSEEGEISGSGQVLVFGPDIYLQSFQKKEADSSYKFTTKLNQIVLDDLRDSLRTSQNEYIGEPVKNYSVSANVVKITYLPGEEIGSYYDYINKVVRKRYIYRKEERVMESINGITDNNGEWSFNQNLFEEPDSFYRIDFIAHDFRGKYISSSTYAWRSDYNSWDNFRTSLNINNNPSQGEFSKGDKINLELQVTKGEKPDKAKVLFYRYQNNIEKSEIKSSLIYEENFEDSFSPSVQYRAVILGPYGFEESNSVTASFKETDNKLSIDIGQDKEKYRPGEQINIDLKVKDQNNKGVSSEVNVAVVDEAIFHILPYEYYSKDILIDLYANIWVYPLTHASQYVLIDEAGAEKGGCFVEGTMVLMGDNSLKNIKDIKIGDQILTRSGEQDGQLAPAIVQGISEHWVKEYLIINDYLGVTPEHRLYVNGQWVYAGNIKVGDELINQRGEIVRDESDREKQEFVPVYNIIVSKYHTYFANDLYVHNEEKGGQSRANFVDVAFYDTVQTDKKGEASISFVAPDNITAWRATAQAFATESFRAGQNIKLIKTSLPFFVDASLNNFYLAGDSPMLRVRAFGTDLSQTAGVEFEVKSESLNIQEKINSSGSFAYIPLGSLSEGEHEIIISGQQGKNKDAIVRKIEVVESYFKKSESSFYELTDSLVDIDGNENGFTKIKFMDLGQGSFYYSLLRNAYNSGIRADQIVAKYLANKYLTDYFEEFRPEESLDLSGYHLEGGGLGLFPYGDEDLALTAKLADLVPESIFKEKVSNYLSSSLTNEKADVHRISKALYGLASLNKLVLAKINFLKDDPNLNLEDKIYLALGLAKLGDKEGAREIYQNEIRNQLRFQGQEAWLHEENDITQRVKLTGLVAVLASYLEEGEARVLGAYIMAHNPEKDLDSLEELLYIKSELTKSENHEVKFKYQTSVRSDSVALKNGKSYQLILPYDELQSIKFSDIEGDIALISFYERAEDPQKLTKNSELSLTRTYLVNGRPVSSLKEGEVVLVRLDPKIAQSAIDGGYQIIDYLPSGLKLITQPYYQKLSGGTVCDLIWPPAIVENNIVYFNIWKGFNTSSYCTNITLNYYARVVSRGSYKSNPALIQSLKDLESLNISSEDLLEIK
jgi:hypothetical protein